VTDRDARGLANLRAVEPVIESVDPFPNRELAQEPRHRRWWKAGTVVITALGVAVALLLSFQWVRSRSTATGAVEPLSFAWRTNTGDVYGPTISRDGKYLAYIWLAPNGDQGLRIRQAAGGTTIDVLPAGPVQYWGIKFSPSGDFLYYLVADRASHSLGTLYRVPKLGGRPERVLGNVNGHIAPSPDGQTVAVVRNNEAPGFAAILTVGTAGGPVLPLMRLEWPVVVQALEWAPDGRSLLCALRRRTTAGDRWQVMEIPSAGGTPTEILPPRSSHIISAAWLPERRGFLMTALDPSSGLPQLWHVSYPDGAERRLTNDLHNYKDLTVTADGRTAVAQSLGHLVQLWIAPGSDGNQAKQIASGTARGAYDALAWTTDSQLLCKWGERDTYDIWRMSPDGRARHQLSVNARDIADTSVAPDGRFVLFTSTRGAAGRSGG
jgi:Tol biopolymer transport system component